MRWEAVACRSFVYALNMVHGRNGALGVICVGALAFKSCSRVGVEAPSHFLGEM